MGRIMRLREAVSDGYDTEDQVKGGGKPSTGTPADKRLKKNKTSTPTPMKPGSVSKSPPAKVTHGL